MGTTQLHEGCRGIGGTRTRDQVARDFYHAGAIPLRRCRRSIDGTAVTKLAEFTPSLFHLLTHEHYGWRGQLEQHCTSLHATEEHTY